MGNHMSFSITKSEEVRVILASWGKQHLDPRQAADLIMVIVISVVYFIQLLAVIYMLWNRSYPPIKAKNPGLMTCVFISSVMWFTGDIQANGHAPLKGTPLQNCKAFGVWIRVLLGVCGMSALIGLRSYGLYRVFCRNLAYRGLGFYIPFIVASAFMVIYGIVLQALPANITIRYMEPVDLCYYNDKYKASLYALLWLTWVIIAALNWCTRNIKSSFNETREILFACVIVFGVLIFMTVMSYTHARYPLNLTLRVLATSLDQFAATTVWWLMMVVPLFKCLTDRQRYLKEWIYKLRADGLQQAYHIEPGTMYDNDNTSGGNLSYLHPNNRKYFGNNHPLTAAAATAVAATAATTTLVPTASNSKGQSQPGSEFFYGASNSDEKFAFPHVPSSDMQDHCTRSSSNNKNLHHLDESSSASSSSAFSLIQHPQSPTARFGDNGNPVSSKRLSEGNTVRWATTQTPSSLHHPVKRPWNKLTSAVNNLGVPSFTSNPVPPIPLSPLSPIPASAAAQPYAPILDYPESSSPTRANSAIPHHRDNDGEDKYSHNGRQLI